MGCTLDPTRRADAREAYTLTNTRWKILMQLRNKLSSGMVIPAHPLALTQERKLDERRQRALTRYYLAAGAGGIAVGVHTTQFTIRRPEHGLLQPVLELASRTIDETLAAAPRPFGKVAGAIGPTRQAVAEAQAARP